MIPNMRHEETIMGGTSILQKLLAVMKDCGYIQKDKKNTFHGYSYASEAAIKDRVHEALVEHRVIPQVSLLGLTEREITRVNAKGQTISEWLTTANVHYKFYCCDTGEFIEGTFYGCGIDPSDKGLYKAITGAIKYLLTSQFLIPTGDDPENDEGRTASKEEKQGKQQEYLRSKGIDPTIPEKHRSHQPPPDVRTASEQHKALILETAKMLDEPPQGFYDPPTDRIIEPKAGTKPIEMRHAATVAEADAQLKEVAKPKKAAPKLTADSIEIRKGMTNMKDMLRAVTGDDTIYYDVLKAHGYSSSAEIPTREIGRRIYLKMGEIHTRLVDEKKLRIELETAEAIYGKQQFYATLGHNGCETIEDVLSLTSEPLESLRRDLKSLGGAA